MKKIIFALAFTFVVSASFAQSKKVHDTKVTTDSSVVAKPDTITGSYFSLEQGKMVQYKALITKEEIKNITACVGWPFYDAEGKLIAYTPCKDYSLKSLVVIPGRELDFINYLRSHHLSFK